MTLETTNQEESYGSTPPEKYTLISVDIDTTGRRLIDEIVQLSAYTPKSQFSQYIMPYMNLNPAARQRHQVRVITVGFYRMLKCMQTFKVLKSKSEVAALKDFLTWMEEIKKNDESSMGVILIYHEERKFIPYVLLEAFKKYNMMDKLCDVVKYFGNSYLLAKEKCPGLVKHSLRQLTKALLDNNQKNQFEGNASVRAKLVYQIVYNIAKNDLKLQNPSSVEELNEQMIVNNMIKLICKKATFVTNDYTELDLQNKIVERQNSFRPVFLQYFKTTLYHRVKAVRFRIILAENGHDYDSLKKIWDDRHKDGILKAIQAIDLLKIEEKQELVEILDCHYDPSKQPLKPTTTKMRRRRSRNRNKENMTPRDTTNGYYQSTNVYEGKTNHTSENMKMRFMRRQRPGRFAKNPLSRN